MPTYTYLCSCPIDQGGHGEFDEFHSIRDDAKLTECPLCRKDKEVSTPVQRILSGGSGRGIVELTGHDLIAKTKQDGKDLSKKVHSNEYQYANILGNDKYEKLQQNIDKRKRGG